MPDGVESSNTEPNPKHDAQKAVDIDNSSFFRGTSGTHADGWLRVSFNEHVW